MARYATYAEFKDSIDLVDSSGSGQTNIERILDAASRNIDRVTNRPDGFIALDTATARIYTGTGKPYLLIHECVEVTKVEVKDSATDSDYDEWAATDWIPYSGDPKSPDFNSLPYDSLMVDPTGDESVFTTGAYTTRGGFRPLTDVTRGVPTCRITAKWGYAVTVPYDIKEVCIMQSAKWYKRLQGAMAGDSLSSAELGLMLMRLRMDPALVRLLEEGRYIKPATGRW